jgi:hypothetical protein
MTAPAGVVLLGAVAVRLPMLDVACNRCPWRGRLRIDRLLAVHGPAMPMPELRRIIAGHVHDVCGVHFPGLIT